MTKQQAPTSVKAPHVHGCYHEAQKQAYINTKHSLQQDYVPCCDTLGVAGLRLTTLAPVPALLVPAIPSPLTPSIDARGNRTSPPSPLPCRPSVDVCAASGSRPDAPGSSKKLLPVSMSMDDTMLSRWWASREWWAPTVVMSPLLTCMSPVQHAVWARK